MTIRIGGTAPDFWAQTTEGPVNQDHRIEW